MLRSFDKVLQADAEVIARLEAVPDGELIDEHGTEDEAAGRQEPTGRHRLPDIKDAFELAVEVLDRMRT
jgi:hypothetical protein